MQRIILLMLFLSSISVSYAQHVQIDGRLQPHLDEFFKTCDSYGIEYNEKLFQLEYIDVVNTLQISERSSTLGMLRRNELGKVVAIDISWMAQLDPQILKVVAFHEFAHYFLEYDTHICDDCDHIMAIVNSSYFTIANHWESQVKALFEQSPVLAKKYQTSVAVGEIKKP